MGRPYQNKYGTPDDKTTLDDLFLKSEIPDNINDVDDALQVPLLTIDLDDVIFNMKPLTLEAFKRAGVPYEKQTSWNIDESFNNPSALF